MDVFLDAWYGDRCGPLGTPALKALEAYQHRSEMEGWLDRVVMTPFWEAVAGVVPPWVHPNVLTAAGNSLVLLASALAAVYCPGVDCASAEAAGTLPRWVLLVIPLCLLAYQTLDAIDGKHARALGCGSPVGCLWDHGCDAFTWPHFFLSTFAMGSLGGGVRLTVSLGVGLLAAFVAYWEARHCGPLRWPAGTTESQFLAMGLGVVSCFFGASLFAAPLPLPPTLLGLLPSAVATAARSVVIADVVCVAGLAGPLRNAVEGARRVFCSRHRHEGATRELVAVLALLCCAAVMRFSEPFGREHPIELLALLTLSFSHLCNKVIVFDVCKQGADTWEPAVLAVLAPIAILAFNQSPWAVTASRFALVPLGAMWAAFGGGALRQILDAVGMRMWAPPAACVERLTHARLEARKKS